MKKLVFLLEEASAKEVLSSILPKFLPPDSFICIPHEGKSDLQKSIPRKLRGWKDSSVQFVILHDKDSADCIELKEKLKKLTVNGNRNDTLIRIVCTELESWFLGDLDAIQKAYSIDLSATKNKVLFHNPDSIGNAKQELRKLIPQYQEISGSAKISKYMDIGKNKSKSFKVFITGVQRLYNEQGKTEEEQVCLT